ncbi:MAG: hypothetical protein SPF05_02520 [Lachnospiraceae bacterium]|nr:hypothetical protein [Lachnospiraceae bacterium]
MKTLYDKHGMIHLNAGCLPKDYLGADVNPSFTELTSWESVDRSDLEAIIDEKKLDGVSITLSDSVSGKYFLSDDNGKNALIDRLDKVIRWATELGLYIILRLGGIGALCDSDCGKLNDAYKKDILRLIKYLSRKYSSYGNLMTAIAVIPLGAGNISESVTLKVAQMEFMRDYLTEASKLYRQNHPYGLLLTEGRIFTNEELRKIDKQMADVSVFKV